MIVSFVGFDCSKSVMYFLGNDKYCTLNICIIPTVIILLTRFHVSLSISDFPKVLVVSLDGFRHDYIDDCLTPTIKRLRGLGVQAPYMKNVFPTKTFPNHHSIATGVYPEVHGVLDSTVYDSKDSCTNRTVIGYSYDLFHYNNEILPIWTLNQLSGKGRHSGVMMWPGGEFPYGCKKTRPTFYQSANFKVTFKQRVDTVLSWFTHPVTPANLVMLYFEEPDLHGHAFGVNSPEERDQIKNVDNALQYLEQQLLKYKLNNVVYVFVLSDHGMINIDQRNIIDLNKYVDNSTYIAASYSPVLQIFPKEGKEDLVLKGLQEARFQSKDAFDFYLKNEIPISWNYRNSNRTPPILVVAKEGYAFQDLYSTIDQYNEKFHIEPNPRNKYGIHGYSNDNLNMYPIFFAWGRNIEKKIIDPFDSVKLYPTWALLLDLEIPDHIHSTPMLHILQKYVKASLNTEVGGLQMRNNTTAAFPMRAAAWAYWLAGLLAVGVSLAVVAVIYFYLKDIRSVTTNLKPAGDQIYRVEAQHLLISDSEDDIKS